MRQYHLAAARVIDADSLHTYSTVGAARSTLEKRGDHFGGSANAQGHALGSIGGCHASSARSGALEDVGWTATRKDEAGYFAKLATARASLS
jgi:hypothetical protein